MQNIIEIIQKGAADALKSLYDQDVEAKSIGVDTTRKEFEGDYTIVVFPFTKFAKGGPEQIAQAIGQKMQENVPEIGAFNVVKGFLNLSVRDSYWTKVVENIFDTPNYGKHPANGKRAMIEYSSPNTNKPLHLGHIRNILLGWSCSKILSAAGYDVVKLKVVNDRGIAICKSMLAWEKFGNESTPDSTGIKGDHFVGKYYVEFDKKLTEEYKIWQQTADAKQLFEDRKKQELSEEEFFKDYKNQYFNDNSQLGKEARQMLLDWESHHPIVVELWQTMNGWVYQGFNETYKKLGVGFDKIYYESNTYLLGKDIIEDGLNRDVFYKKEDGSVWIDLTDVKLDHKVVLRSDGTSVYITQDIGMAHLRNEEYHADKVVYVVGNEQNYHFQVLFEILKKLGEPYANGLYHLSYGMVELPHGKMKSREGTVVDADDLIAEVIQEARNEATERGEIEEMTAEVREDTFRKIGLAALKYHMIKVDPKKKMMFDPKESVDLQGQTGPYIQYPYVRINGVLKRAEKEQIDLSIANQYQVLQQQEKDLILLTYDFPNLVLKAAEEYDPSLIANYCYALAKAYNKFWHDLSIYNAAPEAKAFRLKLSKTVGEILKSGMEMLGIEMPERM